MNIVTVRFVTHGSGKIYAIKAVRDMFGIGLKEAKNAVENPAGVQMYECQVNLLKELRYLSIQADNVNPRYTGLDDAWWRIESCDPPVPTKLV